MKNGQTLVCLFVSRVGVGTAGTEGIRIAKLWFMDYQHQKHVVCDSSVYPPWLQGRSPSAVVGIGHCKEIDFQLTKLCIFWRFPSVT